MTWEAIKLFCGGVPRWVWHLAGIVVLLGLLWVWDSNRLEAAYDRGVAAAEAKCLADAAKANEAAHTAEVKRDDKALDIAEDSHEATAKVADKTKDKTHERAEQISRVPAGAGCVLPVGLPDLAPAIDSANAANR